MIRAVAAVKDGEVIFLAILAVLLELIYLNVLNQCSIALRTRDTALFILHFFLSLPRPGSHITHNATQQPLQRSG